MSAMSQSQFDLAELFRRVENIAKRGTVSNIDTDKARVRVTIGDVETDWVPWLALRAGSDRTWWAPSIGEQVLLISESGDLRNGVALIGLYQNAHPAPEDDGDIHSILWEDGARAAYDKGAHALDIDLPNAGSFTVRVGASTFSMTSGQILLKTPRLAIVEGE